ncbi:hypothetical protein HPB47_018077, partial [Ixodes persulcatus]
IGHMHHPASQRTRRPPNILAKLVNNNTNTLEQGFPPMEQRPGQDNILIPMPAVPAPIGAVITAPASTNKSVT